MYIIRVFNITTTIKRQTIDFENYLVEMWKKREIIRTFSLNRLSLTVFRNSSQSNGSRLITNFNRSEEQQQ